MGVMTIGEEMLSESSCDEVDGVGTCTPGRWIPVSISPQRNTHGDAKQDGEACERVWGGEGGTRAESGGWT